MASATSAESMEAAAAASLSLKTEEFEFQTLYRNGNYNYVELESEESEGEEEGCSSWCSTASGGGKDAWEWEEVRRKLIFDAEICDGKTDVEGERMKILVEFENNDGDSSKELTCLGTSSIYGEEYFGKAEVFRPMLTPMERKILGIAEIPAFFLAGENWGDSEEISEFN